MVLRNDIIDWCNQQLAIAQFKDYAPNGLQVEGAAQVGKIVCAVTASRGGFGARSGGRSSVGG